MPKETSVSSACAAACGQMQGKCTSIKINLDEDDELPFLNELKINPQSKEPVTVVINAQGQVTGSFAGAVEVGNLVQAATKKAGGVAHQAARAVVRAVLRKSSRAFNEFEFQFFYRYLERNLATEVETYIGAAYDNPWYRGDCRNRIGYDCLEANGREEA